VTKFLHGKILFVSKFGTLDDLFGIGLELGVFDLGIENDHFGFHLSFSFSNSLSFVLYHDTLSF